MGTMRMMSDREVRTAINELRMANLETSMWWTMSDAELEDYAAHLSTNRRLNPAIVEEIREVQRRRKAAAQMWAPECNTYEYGLAHGHRMVDEGAGETLLEMIADPDGCAIHPDALRGYEEAAMGMVGMLQFYSPELSPELQELVDQDAR